MSESTRVTEEGQATIPKALREKYDIEPGDEVVWIDTEDGIVVKKRTHTGARGLLVPDDTSDEKREEIAEELTRRLRERRESETFSETLERLTRRPDLLDIPEVLDEGDLEEAERAARQVRGRTDRKDDARQAFEQ